MSTHSAEKSTRAAAHGGQLSELHVVLLAIAFLAEMMMLGGLGWAGWSMGPNAAVSVTMMVLLPVSVAVVWGVWCAPKAALRLRTPARWAVKTTLFAGTFLLLLVSAPMPGPALFGLVMWLLFVVSLPADRSSLRRSR